MLFRFVLLLLPVFLAACSQSSGASDNGGSDTSRLVGTWTMSATSEDVRLDNSLDFGTTGTFKQHSQLSGAQEKTFCFEGTYTLNGSMLTMTLGRAGNSKTFVVQFLEDTMTLEANIESVRTSTIYTPGSIPAQLQQACTD